MTPIATNDALEQVAARYVELLKGCLTRELFPDAALTRAPTRASGLQRVARRLTRGRERPARTTEQYDQDARLVGRDWPAEAETMIGRARLDNLHACIVDVIRRGVPGDLIETGVWRGGATILMRGILEAYGDASRAVWVADSFQGLPKPDAEKYPADAGDRTWTFDQLAIGVEQVKANFARYGLLDDRVRFLVGWFRDTLPTAPIEQLAVMRLDGDLYESTMDALVSLYPKLSPGGYVIVDDYGACPPCRAAVEDFRTDREITDPIMTIDWTGVYWQRGEA
jgi:O-methyltransferase